MNIRRGEIRLIAVICWMIPTVLLYGQFTNQYDARLALSSVDTSARVACYNLEISNPSSVSWVLGAFNLGLLYDARAACFASDALIADDIVYSHNVQDQITSTTTNLVPYGDSLGFLRINLDPEDQPASLDSLRVMVPEGGAWQPVIQICFDLKFDDITNPQTCMSVDFIEGDLNTELMIPESLLQEWAGAFVLIDVAPQNLQNIVPNRTRTSCFILEEDTPELCSDGIDNDEDGLTDCMDIDGCSPGSLAVQRSTPNCFTGVGAIEITNGFGENIQYSIDGGMSFQEDSIFSDLSPGLYDVYAVRNGVTSCAFTIPAILADPGCEEADDETCSDGIDNDADGLVDCDDPDCGLQTNDVSVTPPTACPLLNDGTLDISTNFLSAEFSLDGGETWVTSPIRNITQGTYDILVRNVVTLCEGTIGEVVVMPDEPCPPRTEVCADGIDNDQNGLIDCDDPECSNALACEVPLEFYAPNIFAPLSQVNNRFVVEAPDNSPLTILALRVFDKWGNLVFNRENTSTTDVGHSWDGRRDNQSVASGVYVYHIVFLHEGREVDVSGDVTIVN